MMKPDSLDPSRGLGRTPPPNDLCPQNGEIGIPLTPTGKTHYVLSCMKYGILPVLCDPSVEQTPIVEELFRRLGADSHDSAEYLSLEEIAHLTQVIIPTVLTAEFIRGDRRRAMNVAMVVWLASTFDPTFRPIIPPDIGEFMPTMLPTGEQFPLLERGSAIPKHD